MDREKKSRLAKLLIIPLGVLCLALALFTMPAENLTPGFWLIAIFSTLIAPRMSVALPRSRFAISFTDACVFLAFLLYGGPAAIIIAALESTANCIYLRSKGYSFGRWMIPANVSIGVVSTAATYGVWLLIPAGLFSQAAVGSTAYVLSTLGCLAIAQFVIASFLAAVFVSIKEGRGLWITWRKDCFSSSLTQIVGAALAGMVYKVINFGDPITGVIAFAALGIAYLSYRQSIGELNAAISQSEAAERRRAELERERRQEAEKHAEQLALSLEKEEAANDALRRSEKDLQHAALYDSLTDLPNRRHLSDLLRKLMTEYAEDPEAKYQVLFIDIKKFKNINDSLGHGFGDKVLKIAAKRFVRLVNPSDMVARLGGVEFAIVLKGLNTSGKALKVARRIHESISVPFSLSGHRISIGLNIGIAPCDSEHDSPEEILRDADIAMQFAKERNSGVEIFTKELRVRFLERVRFEDDLRQAIERGELSLSYQPLIDIQSGTLLGFEALLRWHHTELGQIPPNKFIPIAEESCLIVPMTNWILEQAATQLAAWQRISAAYKDLIVSVNISGKHLSNNDLIPDVENALAVSGIRPDALKLEITESAAMENADHTIKILNRLKALGVQLSIDDFGTGYSSLSYLHRLPFDTLKIDRSFVYSVGERGEGSEILQTIISLAKNLKKKVIAEGIETEAQLALLQHLGCDYGQGYLLARPMNVEKLEKELYSGRSWLPAQLSDTLITDLDVTEQTINPF